jgi:ectoine hydroxylase-related dioxygenase (phytanoyl-CoA dioxygenase family)
MRGVWQGVGVDARGAVIERAAAAAETFQRDGVVCLPGALDADEVAAVAALFDHGEANPSPGAYEVYGGGAGRFRIDTFHAAQWPAYAPAYAGTKVPDLVAALWGGTDEMWFFYEQLFRKEGPMRRTPWHQDSTYLPTDGEHIAVVWIPLDPLDAETSLEFVRGSHLGPMYNTSAFAADDDTKPIIDDPAFPRLPDIEADRAAHDIVSWAVEPGDVVVFHVNVLHGGSPAREGQLRRTVSLRYFGPDAVVGPRPSLPVTNVEGKRVSATLADSLGGALGEPFRHPMFPKVRG